jgi:hypothetical protein
VIETLWFIFAMILVISVGIFIIASDQADGDGPA